MPNWCMTDINVNFSDSQKAAEFEEKLNEWMSDCKFSSSWDGKWLGNIAHNAGVVRITETDDGKLDIDPKLFCRGSVVDAYACDDAVKICTESAWGPALEMWVKIVQKKLC